MIFILGFLFTSIFGTIAHFFYKYSNNNKLIGFLFGNDESIKSHLKLGVTPMLMWLIVEKIKVINNNIIPIRFISIVFFIIFLSAIYLAYKKIFKKNNLIFDISLFYISVLLSYFVSFLLINIINLSLIVKIIGYLFIIIIIYIYVPSHHKESKGLTLPPTTV